MIESGTHLLPPPKPGKKLGVFMLGFEDEAMDELRNLLQTLDSEILGDFKCTLKKIHPGTYIGSGKLEEVKGCLTSSIEAVIIDGDLSPRQLQNLEKFLGVQTFDRSGVIIEIFSRNARTKEAKTQVELARLQYLLPRLAHYWTHFERQRGGIGLKGMGEKQLEVDRRLLQKRMKVLKRRLTKVENERKIQRSGRKDVLKVALVGYTNAGKSTLLNQLTHSRVLAENKLFATLDSSVRQLDPDSRPPIVAIDTVGFISRIPTSLIASFRSTLEELEEADLLLHVVDASSPYARKQFEVTEEVLEELKLGKKPRLVVINKMDLVKSPGELNWSRIVAPGALRASALKPDDGIRVRDAIMEHFKRTMSLLEVVIPYTESKLDSMLQVHASIEKKKFMEKGTFYRLRIHEAWAAKLELARFQT